MINRKFRINSKKLKLKRCDRYRLKAQQKLQARSTSSSRGSCRIKFFAVPIFNSIFLFIFRFTQRCWQDGGTLEELDEFESTPPTKIIRTKKICTDFVTKIFDSDLFFDRKKFGQISEKVRRRRKKLTVT